MIDPSESAVEFARLPDVSNAHWEAALRGLRSFIELGYAAEALRLGWPRDELYAVPPLWARVDLCGAGLSIGDREVIEITSDAIAIRTPSGVVQRFYRKPAVDYRVAYEAHLKPTRGNYRPNSEEAHLRAVEATVNLFLSNDPDASLEDARVAVLAAIAKAKEKV